MNDEDSTSPGLPTPPDYGGILVERDTTPLFSDGPSLHGQLYLCYIRPLCDTKQRTSLCPHSYQGIPLTSNEVWTTCNVKDVSSTPPDVGNILYGRDLCAEVIVLDSPDVPLVPKAQGLDNSLSQDLDLAKPSLKDDSLTPLEDFLAQMYDKKFEPRKAQAKLDEIIASMILLDLTLGAYFDGNISFRLLRGSLSLTALGYVDESNFYVILEFFDGRHNGNDEGEKLILTRMNFDEHI